MFKCDFEFHCSNTRPIKNGQKFLNLFFNTCITVERLKIHKKYIGIRFSCEKFLQKNKIKILLIIYIKHFEKNGLVIETKIK